MTKKQSLYYLGAVIVIIILGYLYTTIVKTSKEVAEPVVEVAMPAEEASVSEVHPVPGKNDLHGTDWRWLRTENATGTIISEPLADKPFVLSFADDDSMGSQTDCNTFAGSYKHEDVALTFGTLAATKMFCEGSQEQEYAAQLQQVNEHAILNNMLLLSLGESGGMMFFVKVAQ